MQGKAVFITGCDGGFGRALAKHLHKLGFTVFAGCLLKVQVTPRTPPAFPFGGTLTCSCPLRRIAAEKVPQNWRSFTRIA